MSLLLFLVLQRPRHVLIIHLDFVPSDLLWSWHCYDYIFSYEHKSLLQKAAMHFENNYPQWDLNSGAPSFKTNALTQGDKELILWCSCERLYFFNYRVVCKDCNIYNSRASFLQTTDNISISSWLWLWSAGLQFLVYTSIFISLNFQAPSLLK